MCARQKNLPKSTSQSYFCEGLSDSDSLWVFRAEKLKIYPGCIYTRVVEHWERNGTVVVYGPFKGHQCQLSLLYFTNAWNLSPNQIIVIRILFLSLGRNDSSKSSTCMKFYGKNILVYIFTYHSAHYPDVFIQITTMSIRLIWLSLQINVDEFVVHLYHHKIHVFEHVLLCCCAYEKPFNMRKRLLENADELKHIGMKWYTLAHEMQG